MFDCRAYDLSEVSFKLGMLRIIIIDRDLIADQVEARSAVAAALRYGRGKIAAGAVAGHGQSRGIAAEVGDALGGPPRRRERVLIGTGKRRLGRLAIVDADDDRIEFHGKRSRQPLMREEIARHPSTAVEEYDGGRWCFRGPIDARGDRAGEFGRGFTRGFEACVL